MFIGDTVKWRGAGKVSRLEGKRGQIVSGKITSISEERGTVSAMPDHRLVEGAPYFGMGACINIADLIQE